MNSQAKTILFTSSTGRTDQTYIFDLLNKGKINVQNAYEFDNAIYFNMVCSASKSHYYFTGC
jgi:hypothetical protein